MLRRNRWDFEQASVPQDGTELLRCPICQDLTKHRHGRCVKVHAKEYCVPCRRETWHVGDSSTALICREEHRAE